LSRNESGRIDALKSDSTHNFFRNACTKSNVKTLLRHTLITNIFEILYLKPVENLCSKIKITIVVIELKLGQHTYAQSQTKIAK
jgi:hypothetical protein